MKDFDRDFDLEYAKILCKPFPSINIYPSDFRTIKVLFFEIAFGMKVPCSYSEFLFVLLQRLVHSNIPLKNKQKNVEYQLFWQQVIKDDFHSLYWLLVEYPSISFFQDRILNSFSDETKEKYYAMETLYDLKMN